MLSKSTLTAIFEKLMPVTPTPGQETAMSLLADFLDEHSATQLFILKGYAGTGKTTLVSTLVKALNHIGVKNVLLAPTGRAAKVFSGYARKRAYTLHKHLYRLRRKDDILTFSRRQNRFRETLFIVDEVSMIPDSSTPDTFAGRSLLEDLIQYVFEGQHCKLLFIGDQAQLPPVHASDSPALMESYLHANFNIAIDSYQLTEVVRQALDSGILHNATRLRRKMEREDWQLPFFSSDAFPDFSNVNGIDLEELLNDLYSKLELHEIVTITHSNKRAYIFNQEIRNRVLFRENMIASGDLLMTVKNNYYWVDERSDIGFIANGDMLELLSINKQEEIYGFRFADVTIRLRDYPDSPSIDVKINLESLNCEGASLPNELLNRLYHEVALDYAHIPSARTRYLKIKNDPYLNALQVKFGYSLTCHKTQGGQWRVVLIDQGYLRSEQLDKEYLRWLYTAITRATEQVYLINFPEAVFEEPAC